MKLEKFKQKIFGRKATNFELFYILIGTLAGLTVILSKMGFLSVGDVGITESITNPVVVIIGSSLLMLIAFYLYTKKKDMILGTVIIILSVLVFVGGTGLATGFFTTVFNTSGNLGDLPTTISECQSINGVIIPPTSNCAKGYIETSNVEGNLCCVPDDCKVWKREYNQQTKLFEFICQDGK